MERQPVRVFVDTVTRLLRSGARANVQRVLERRHPADIALLFRHLTPAERCIAWELVRPPRRQAEVLAELDTSLRTELIASLSPAQVATLLEYLPSDDAADIVADLDAPLREQVLAAMKGRKSRDVEDLMEYPEDSAGRIMSPRFFALPDTATVEEAIEAVRQADDLETALYVYVVNEFGHLVGVVSLRQLVVSPPDCPLRDIMETDVVTVTPETDQEEVAAIVARYNFLAVPVVDDHRRLIGIVTVDDIIDIINDEATEDILRLAGWSEASEENHTIRSGLRGRALWAAVSFAGGLLTVPLVQAFAHEHLSLDRVAPFLPLVLVLAGNLGIQSSTIAVRELSTGAIDLRQFGRFVRREAIVGMAFGALFGALGGVVATLGAAVDLGLAVAVAVWFGITATCVVGAATPFLLQRFRLDPSFAVGPVVKVLADVIGLAVYLGAVTVARAIFGA